MTLKTHNIVREAWQKTKGTKLSMFICGLCILITHHILFPLLPAGLFDNLNIGDNINIDFAEIIPKFIGLCTDPYFIFVTLLMFSPRLPYSTAAQMIGLKAARGETPSKGIAFHYFHKIIPVFFIYLISTVAFAYLGFVLYYLIELIINNTQHGATNQVLLISGYAGIFLLSAITLFIFLIVNSIVRLSILLAVDKNLNPIQAYQASFHALKGHYVKVCLLSLSLTALLVLGSLTIIGLLWIMPMLSISIGILYRELVDKQHEHAEPNPV